MKLKYISLIVSVAGILFSCSTEEAIGPDRSVVEGIDTSVSLVLNVGGTSTKAHGEVGEEYELANPDELKVNKATVAIFKMETVGDVSTPTTLIGIKDVTAPEATATAGDTLAYKVDGIPAKTGDIRILVIANSKNSYGGLTMYSQFEAEIEKNLDATNQNTAVFEPTELVKVGIKDIILSEDNNKNIEVAMTQLAARIRLDLKVLFEEEITADPYYLFSGSGKYTEEQVLAFCKDKNSIPDDSGIKYENSQNIDDLGLTYNGKPVKGGSGAKFFWIEGDVLYVEPKAHWDLELKNLSIENIETESKMLLGVNPESQNLKTLVIPEENLNDTIVFYSYQKEYQPNNPLTVEMSADLIKKNIGQVTVSKGKTYILWVKNEIVEGVDQYTVQSGYGSAGYAIYVHESTIITEPGEPIVQSEELERRTMPLTFIIDPAKSMDGCNTDGVIHGNNYDITGTIGLTTQDITFTYEQTVWEAITRPTYVDVEKVNYLEVKDLFINMPNVTSATTTFQSSSNVSITNIQVTPTTDDNVSVTCPNTSNGMISISGPIPGNFVPRTITFTVENSNGLSQNVEVKQYPPLYIETLLSDNSKTASQGQNNWNIYRFTSLVADFTNCPTPDDFYETTTIKGNSHSHSYIDSVKGKTYAEYIRTLGIMGYPKLDSQGCTVDDDENNRRISPKFMLASQYGTVSASSYANARYNNNGSDLSCRNYVESQNGVMYSDWRLPTLAELYLIDVLQNVKACDVKAILEGRYYWSANNDSSVKFMDARVNIGSSTSSSWRCVHDVK